jgi:hypothetical protein
MACYMSGSLRHRWLCVGAECWALRQRKHDAKCSDYLLLPSIDLDCFASSTTINISAPRMSMRLP